MLHRRLLYDDARGVVEPINEPGYDEFGRHPMKLTFVFLGGRN
jgi:hypothetical protein